MPDWIISLLVSAMTGGLTGALANIGWNWWNTRQAARRKEMGTIASLTGELRHTLALCELNTKALEDAPSWFRRFPTAVASRATSEERHDYPRLAAVQDDLKAYTMGVIHMNQLMDLYDHLSSAADRYVRTEGAPPLQHDIGALCAGESRMEGIGSEGFVYLPTFTEQLLAEIEGIMHAPGETDCSQTEPASAPVESGG